MATVNGDVVEVAASWAVRHRPAPGLRTGGPPAG
jgi:hypothetical protein